MKRLFLTIALAAVSVFGLMAEEKTKVYEFGDITRLEAGFLYQLHITEGTSGKVKIVYESDYEKHLRVKYTKSGSSLRLGLDDIPNKFKRGNQPHIHVYLEMDRIDEIMISGGGSDAFFDGEFTGEDVDISLGVAANLSSLKLHSTDLNVSCSGASKAYIDAVASNGVNVEMSGASRGEFNITAKEMEVELSGATDVRIKGTIHEKAEVELSGASEIELEGSVKDFKFEASGASSIYAKDFIAFNARGQLSGASKGKIYAEKSIVYDNSKASKIQIYGLASLKLSTPHPFSADITVP